MTAEEFSAEAIVCSYCGEEPKLVKETVEELFSGKPPRERYICRCDACSYMGFKSGRCKTPEAAVRSWNKKNISLTEEYNL